MAAEKTSNRTDQLSIDAEAFRDNLDELARVMEAELELDADELQERLRFLEITSDDVELLRDLHVLLDSRGDAFSSAFYDHLQKFPALRTLLPDQQAVERLKRAQSWYSAGLTSGKYDATYVHSRLRIGLIHDRVGLQAKWYIGAYRKYLSELIDHMLLHFNEKSGPLAPFARAFDSILKVAFLDMGLALETFFQVQRNEIERLKNYSEELIANMPTGLMVIAPNLHVRTMNDKMRVLLDVGADQLVNDVLLTELINNTSLTDIIAEMLSTGREQRELTLPVDPQTNNKFYSVVMSNSVFKNERMLLVQIDDITERKHTEDRLRHMASHDVLTGLPNRALLHDRLMQGIANSRRSGKLLAVMLIDLDRFKVINDSLGHKLGDQMLVETACRLSDCVRSIDTVARLGGDEFLVVMVDAEKIDEVSAFAEKIHRNISTAMQLDGHEIFPSASIGISLFPDDGYSTDLLLMNADTAMYRAKDAGRNTYRFYAKEMNDRSLERLTLEGRLQHALERQEFFLHYQPQVNIATGKLVGVEALIRWKPDGLPMLHPDDFIPVAEETGMIVAIGEWALRTACRQNKVWLDAGYPPINMAVNVSGRQFRQTDLDRMIQTILDETGCPAKQLQLEITESVVMHNTGDTMATLDRLNQMGVQLCIDDFGTGFSSLTNLKRMPIRAIKIDQSFVRDISTDADDAAIVQAVIGLAHSMKLTVIGEGVETFEQRRFLRRWNCDQMQGHLISRPMDADELEQRFTTQFNMKPL